MNLKLVVQVGCDGPGLDKTFCRVTAQTTAEPADITVGSESAVAIHAAAVEMPPRWVKAGSFFYCPKCQKTEHVKFMLARLAR